MNFKDFSNYNIWANRRLIELCKKYSDLLEQPIKSSFPTIRRTLLHIYDAERGWLNRLNNYSHTAFPSTTFEGSNEKIFDVVLNTSIELNMFTESKSSTFYEKNCDYKTTQGQPYTDTYGEIILHIVNHSSYHRGQIVTMLRGLGATEMHSMDYINYKRQVSKT